jgi:UDP-N-acetylmuramate-alanine ligase
MLARAPGQTAIENFALMTICLAHLNAGAIDEAQRSADEFASVARRRRDEEAMAYALVVDDWAQTLLAEGPPDVIQRELRASVHAILGT